MPILKPLLSCIIPLLPEFVNTLGEMASVNFMVALCDSASAAFKYFCLKSLKESDLSSPKNAARSFSSSSSAASSAERVRNIAVVHLPDSVTVRAYNQQRIRL